MNLKKNHIAGKKSSNSVIEDSKKNWTKKWIDEKLLKFDKKMWKENQKI